MPIDLQIILKILRLVLHIMELIPADFDHQPLATTARELIEVILTPSQKGG